MQNLVLVLSSTEKTDQIIAFIEADATLHIPVEKKKKAFEDAFPGYFQWTKSERPSVMNLLPLVIHNITWKS